jgi:hypothetical protein
MRKQIPRIAPTIAPIAPAEMWLDDTDETAASVDSVDEMMPFWFCVVDVYV